MNDDLFAAVDLGSNSFHLLLARRSHSGFETVERLKEKVQLLAGFADGRLHPDAVTRGLACLARFAQRLAAVPRCNVQMVGTHALREAADRTGFAAAAERIVGVPLEVVSGAEEARLVYVGVAHHVSADPGRARLVVDVGGGSTELAWSAPGNPGVQPARVASYKVGCVALRDWCFAPGVAQAEAYAAARDRAVRVLAGVEHPDGAEVIGTSGTVESVQSVLAANGWGGERITREGIDTLSDAVVSGRWLVEAGLPGLAPERVDIFPAGLAVVDAAFRVLDLDAMRYVDASLQDGLLYRHLEAPDAALDLRAATVARLKGHFRVDEAQAARVRRTALALFDAAAAWWREPGRWRDLLGWAAELHELGRAVAPRHYHRHGAYLLQNADLRAFSREEQLQLVLLLRGHRRAFPGLAFRAWEAATRTDLVRLLALLRIAVIVNRSHTDQDVPAVGAAAADDALTVFLPDGWLAGHRLSAKELEVETAQLADAGIRLSVVPGPAPPPAQST